MAKRTGIWLVGARGGVATTAILGLSALRRGLVPEAGLVTGLAPFAQAQLTPWANLVVGGHEVRDGDLFSSATALGLPIELIQACGDDLEAINQRIVPGVLYRSGPVTEELSGTSFAQQATTPRAAVEAIRRDLVAFAEREDLQRVVVVLVSSTEPPTDPAQLPDNWAALSKSLEDPRGCALRAGSLYAIAALGAGFSFVNFTPSLGASCAAIDELAVRNNAPHAGRDGKTGETLLKTVLAPMFASRNLDVMSWVGHNILGNADGQVLDSAEHKQSKLGSKSASLGALLGRDPQSLVSIEYVPSLGERKTAWNHVHFRGFLGVEMTLQVTWQGHDSALAAPLVLDLTRLVDASARRGERGALIALSSFFKEPYGAPYEGHMKQFEQLLQAYAG